MRVQLTALSQWVSIVALLLSVANLLWAWISRPARDVGARVDDVNDRIDEAMDGLKGHDRRIQRVEDDMRHLPTKKDLHEVEIKITSIKTELDVVAKVVSRIDDFLRSNKP
nr:DUF2730 family protein [Novosphingobium hassiacum]